MTVLLFVSPSLPFALPLGFLFTLFRHNSRNTLPPLIFSIATVFTKKNPNPVVSLNFRTIPRPAAADSFPYPLPPIVGVVAGAHIWAGWLIPPPQHAPTLGSRRTTGWPFIRTIGPIYVPCNRPLGAYLALGLGPRGSA